MKAVSGILGLIVTAFLFGGATVAADDTIALMLHVAPNGNDAWSGRLARPDASGTDGPFATLHAACRAARQIGTSRARTILIQAGEYFLGETVILSQQDNGLTIETAAGARVCLYGGRELSGWESDGDGLYAVSLPGVKEGTWDFRALIVNGRYCPPARLPETGFFEHTSVFDVPWMSTTGGGWKRKPTTEELTSMKYKPEDLGPWLDIRNVEITVYHMWDESLVGVSANDPTSHTLTFSTPSGHPPGAFGVKKYVVWNVREGMTQPGQWYLDRTRGKVVYRPLPGEDMGRARVIAPTVESIISLVGGRDNPIRNITIRGLTLCATTTPLRAGGFGAGHFLGVLNAVSARDCTFTGIEIVNACGQAIAVSGSNLRVERCHAHHVGACGIRFQGDGIRIADNEVHDVGLTYPSAIALTGGGRDCGVVHNHVYRTPYSAVTCGGQNNVIEGNRIHHAMQELHDGAGIYCFGGKGLVLRDNFIYDIVDTGGYGASAYYLDEQCEGCIVEKNLSINVARPSHNHMAKNNTIRNNVFVSDGDMQITFPRSSGYVFEKNVLYAQGRITIDNYEGITTAVGNLFFSGQGKVECRKLDQYNRTGTYFLEPDSTNLQTDPMLAAYEQGEVRFAPESPARELGIEPIDVSDAGPRPQ
ncbi:MAG: right-handed parallel beta-helix repeat-containing protein [Phycisphaerae bacterium]|nr:right-handed parallel beta-helix repeat-containing protein [Phycisphaerae bacterium]